MSSHIPTQHIVERAEPTQKNERDQGVFAPHGWSCELCFDHERGEPRADSLTAETRRFVDRRLDAAIDELRRLDPGHRFAVRLAIEGLREVREELGL